MIWCKWIWLRFPLIFVPGRIRMHWVMASSSTTNRLQILQPCSCAQVAGFGGGQQLLHQFLLGICTWLPDFRNVWVAWRPYNPMLYPPLRKGPNTERSKTKPGMTSKDERNFHLETTAFWGGCVFYVFFYIHLHLFIYFLLHVLGCLMDFWSCHRSHCLHLHVICPPLQQYVWASCLGHISAVLPPLLGPDRSQPQSHLTNDWLGQHHASSGRCPFGAARSSVWDTMGAAEWMHQGNITEI